MTTTAIFVWLGWGLAGLGFLVCAWALFRDRSRGRKRCPRCWYDMAGVATLPAKCSECGRVVHRERALRRTRRRWIVAAVGLVIGAPGAWVVGHSPAVRTRGWIAAVPSDVLVRIAELPNPRQRNPAPLNKELELRVYNDQLEARHLAVVLNRAVSKDPSGWRYMVTAVDASRPDRMTQIRIDPPQWFIDFLGPYAIRVIGDDGTEFTKCNANFWIGGCLGPKGGRNARLGAVQPFDSAGGAYVLVEVLWAEKGDHYCPPEIVANSNRTGGFWRRPAPIAVREGAGIRPGS